MSRRADTGPADRTDGSGDSECRAVKLSQLEVQVALTPGLSKFDSEVAERPTGGSRCRRLANSTGRQLKRGPKVVTVDTSDASGSEGSPSWGARSFRYGRPRFDAEFFFCPPARPGESTAGTAPPPAGPLAPAVTRAGVAVTVDVTHSSVQPHGGRDAGVTGHWARPPDPVPTP